MSSAAAAGEAPKKKGKMKGILMMLVGALVFVGVGVGAGLYAAGAGLLGAHGAEQPKEDPNAPKLVLKDGVEEPEHEAPKPQTAIAEPEKAPDPSKYKASYFTFEEPFTANLRDSESFTQIGLGAATFYDQKVLDNIKENEMPIRSAILMVMSQQDSFIISTPEGKLKLQKELKTAINEVLKQRTGFGGVENVYFTSMVVQ